MHGAGFSRVSWEPLTHDLPLALCLDLPGHGAAPLVTPSSVAAYARAIEPQLPQQCVLIGHSLGAMVAMDLAVKLQNRVSALVLIESFAGAQVSPLHRCAVELARPLVERVPPRTVGAMAAMGESGQSAQELKQRFSEISPEGLRGAMRAALRFQFNPNLHTITAPTLVITGNRNRKTHHVARGLADIIPQAKLVNLPGGHLLPTDASEAVREAIEGFCEQSLS